MSSSPSAQPEARHPLGLNRETLKKVLKNQKEKQRKRALAEAIEATDSESLIGMTRDLICKVPIEGEILDKERISHDLAEHLLQEFDRDKAPSERGNRHVDQADVLFRDSIKGILQCIQTALEEEA